MTGSGTQLDPYIIFDIDDLQAMENDLNAYYELANDIDASATSGWNGGLGFNPIGRVIPYFTGYFDGKGYYISDLTINRPDTDYVGLFGYVKAGSEPYVKNVRLVNVSIYGNNGTGALIGGVGDTGNLSVSNCMSSGSIVGRQHVGGLIGWIMAAVSYFMTISDSYSTASVSSDVTELDNNNVGGFIGYGDNIDVDECYATGDVVGVRDNVGGFIGLWVRGTIDKCFATGNVSTGNRNNLSVAGGFIGYCNSGAVATNCYARGSVTATGNYAGGFLASLNSPASSINNCYSTGAVSSPGDYVGGFNGRLVAGSINNCFWDTETSGQATSEGGTGKTTAEMKTKSTFTDAGWNFVSIWGIVPAINNGYPYFLSEPIVTTQAVTSIALTTATGNGTIICLGYPTATQHGHCWNTTGTPTIADSKTENGVPAATGAFTSSLTGLTNGVHYYVRAYATSSEGTGYGNEVEFTTRALWKGNIIVDQLIYQHAERMER